MKWHEGKILRRSGTVTGSSHLLILDDNTKILLDCGLYQGAEPQYENFNERFLFNPAEIDIVILSHAHIDHCGRLPKLVKDGFRGRIYATHATRDLTAILLLDSAHIQKGKAVLQTGEEKMIRKRSHYIHRKMLQLQWIYFAPLDITTGLVFIRM